MHTYAWEAIRVWEMENTKKDVVKVCDRRDGMEEELEEKEDREQE